MRPSELPKISADSHVEEPRFLWYDNLPTKWKPKGPRGIQPTSDGAWEMVQHDASPDEVQLKLRAEERSRLAALDPANRLEVMREDGINAEAVFPTIGLYVWSIEEPEIGDACCQIYNDWIHDRFEKVSNRFRTAGVIPTWSADSAVKEAHRIAEMGLGAAMLPLVGRPEWNHPQWEPLWAALAEADLPVVMHQGTGHDMMWYRGPGAAVANLLATQSMAPRSVALLTTAGVLERYPNLHFIFVECNASWLAWTMDTLDQYQRDFQGYGWVRPLLKEKPSFYIARQIHATFQDDPSALLTIPRTGIAPLMWGSDYPHAEGTYPHSRETVDRLFSDLIEVDARAVLGGTIGNLMRFDPAVLATAP